MVQKQETVKTPERIPLRIKFAKRGNLQYISHLDLVRNFTRYIIRSKLPVWYTEGFHPIPKLTFATSLSVGAESECEFLDVKLIEMVDPHTAKLMLDGVMPEGLEISDVYFPDTKFSDIAFSDYEIIIHTSGADEALNDEIERYLSNGPINVIKKTKSGEKEIDIKERIRNCTVSFDSEKRNICINCTLSATNSEFLNPDLLIKALKDKFGVLSGDLAEEYYTILRTRLIAANGKEFR